MLPMMVTGVRIMIAVTFVFGLFRCSSEYPNINDDDEVFPNRQYGLNVEPRLSSVPGILVWICRHLDFFQLVPKDPPLDLFHLTGHNLVHHLRCIESGFLALWLCGAFLCGLSIVDEHRPWVRRMYMNSVVRAGCLLTICGFAPLSWQLGLEMWTRSNTAYAIAAIYLAGMRYGYYRVSAIEEAIAQGLTN